MTFIDLWSCIGLEGIELTQKYLNVPTVSWYLRDKDLLEWEALKTQEAKTVEILLTLKDL